MIYVFGKLVTAKEQAFLKTVLTESDRTARGRHFKAIYSTAKRNNTSLQNAYNIVENNKKYAEALSKKIGWKKLYEVNVYGELVRNCRDIHGRPYVERCSDQGIKEMIGRYIVNKSEPRKTFFQDMKSTIKNKWEKFKGLFSLN